MSSLEKKAMLVVLDGYGKGKEYEGNAIWKAKTPFLDKLEAEAPHTLLKAKGPAVGLPPNSMGGSEVGHFTMAAGRVVLQSLSNIDHQIETGEFFKNPELLKAIEHVKQKGSALHLLGMLSDAGVHSHINHLFALLDLAKEQGLSKVFIHVIGDGRDVSERSITPYLKQVEVKIETLGLGEIVDIVGRFYAMDRDENWERTAEAMKLYTEASEQNYENVEAAVEAFYGESEESDYYFKAKKIGENGIIQSEDAVIFFNFRTDRAKQLTDQFLKLEKPPYFVCFGEYSTEAPVAFATPKDIKTVGKIVSDAGFKQLRISETEKFPHVTFFFNGQRKEPYEGEVRQEVASPKVASYEDEPEMSAPELTDLLLKEIQENDYKLIVVNYANLDLVGHSANLEATIKAAEVIDKSLSQVVTAAREKGYSVVITGDHGNAEEMLDAEGNVSPSHSMNPTQCFVLTDENVKLRQDAEGLAVIGPTLLELMNLPVVPEMTSKSLIINSK